MKVSFPFSLLAAAGIVAAVTVEQYFPACSVQCLKKAATEATTCSAEDGWCICIFDNYVAIVDEATNCVIQACGADVAVRTSGISPPFPLRHARVLVS
jgi:hypothetical protein